MTTRVESECSIRPGRSTFRDCNRTCSCKQFGHVNWSTFKRKKPQRSFPTPQTESAAPAKEQRSYIAPVIHGPCHGLNSGSLVERTHTEQCQHLLPKCSWARTLWNVELLLAPEPQSLDPNQTPSARSGFGRMGRGRSRPRRRRSWLALGLANPIWHPWASWAPMHFLRPESSRRSLV